MVHLVFTLHQWLLCGTYHIWQLPYMVQSTRVAVSDATNHPRFVESETGLTKVSRVPNLTGVPTRVEIESRGDKAPLSGTVAFNGFGEKTPPCPKTRWGGRSPLCAIGWVTGACACAVVDVCVRARAPAYICVHMSVQWYSVAPFGNRRSHTTIIKQGREGFGQGTLAR